MTVTPTVLRTPITLTAGTTPMAMMTLEDTPTETATTQKMAIATPTIFLWPPQLGRNQPHTTIGTITTSAGSWKSVSDFASIMRTREYHHRFSIRCSSRMDGRYVIPSSPQNSSHKRGTAWRRSSTPSANWAQAWAPHAMHMWKRQLLQEDVAGYRQTGPRRAC